MKYQLTRPYSSYKELIKKYGDILKDYGFEEKRITDFASEYAMKMSATLESLNFYDDDCDWIYCFITINSLEELLELRKRLDCKIIIDNDEGIDYLEIYDSYRE